MSGCTITARHEGYKMDGRDKKHGRQKRKEDRNRWHERADLRLKREKGRRAN